MRSVFVSFLIIILMSLLRDLNKHWSDVVTWLVFVLHIFTWLLVKVFTCGSIALTQVGMWTWLIEWFYVTIVLWSVFYILGYSLVATTLSAFGISTCFIGMLFVTLLVNI